ncbi:MAG TPA: MarR family winged helix-turn-helix transcriptional regulator [Brevundimonas sp.]|nr:MarR family winged helix-turn-helix transcriptional regulator [Brevundimonas sp.]
MSGREPGRPATGGAGSNEPLTAGHLFFLFHHLVRQRENALSRELAHSGLTLGQWQVLATLSRLDKATMGEVAAFCATDRTTLTRTVDRMVDEGLIRRDRDLVDRRQVHLNLTAKGWEVFEAAQIDVTRFNDRVTGVLKPEEIQQIQPMIRRILIHVLDDKDWVDDLMAFRRLSAEGPATGRQPPIRRSIPSSQGRRPAGE